MELQHSERKPQRDQNSSHQLESKGKSCSRMSLAVLEKQIPLQSSWPTDSVVGWGLEDCCHFQSSRCLLKVNSYSVFAPPNHITNSIQAHRYTSAWRSHTKGLEWENTSHTRSSCVIQCQDNNSKCQYTQNIPLWFIQFLSLMTFVSILISLYCQSSQALYLTAKSNCFNF